MMTMLPIRAQSEAASEFDGADSCVHVPMTVQTRDNQIIETTGDIWRMAQSADSSSILKIKFRADYGQWRLTDRAMSIEKLYAAQRLGTQATMTVVNDVKSIDALLRWISSSEFTQAISSSLSLSRQSHSGTPIGWSCLSVETLTAFRDHIITSSDGGNHLARVRAFYNWGSFVLRDAAFDPVVANELKAFRIRGNVKGKAVRTRDPIRGALTGDERDALIRGALAPNVPINERIIALLFVELGPNPNQLVRLKQKDLTMVRPVVGRGPAPEFGMDVSYFLRVPRNKKHTGARDTRTRPISVRLGALLEPRARGDPEAPLLDWLRTEQPEAEINSALRRLVVAAHVTSTRVEGLLPITARRLRYTLATEMANEGHSMEKIADVLDHSDLQNVRVYVESSSAVVDRLAVLDEIYDPLVRRFQGQLLPAASVAHPNGTPRKVVPGRALQLPMLDVGGIGLCGHSGVCSKAMPLACYTCESFAAFIDGPHDQVVAAMAQHMDAIVETGAADLRIPLQLANSLAAGRQLLAQIASARSAAVGEER